MRADVGPAANDTNGLHYRKRALQHELIFPSRLLTTVIGGIIHR